MSEKRLIREVKSDRKSRGFSLLELAIAMAVLLVGLLGGIVVIGVASANNGRSKFHTTAATLAESTMERILAIPETATGTAAQTQITDCSGNTYTVETAAGGSPLVPSGGAFSGSIDFSKAAKPNYSMNYTMCSTSGGTYDVRWRVDSGPTRSTQLITVSVKSISANGALLTLPYTLHQLRGDF